jgi:hypothetical protein
MALPTAQVIRLVAIVAVGGFICQLVALSQMLADDFHHPVG